MRSSKQKTGTRPLGWRSQRRPPEKDDREGGGRKELSRIRKFLLKKARFEKKVNENFIQEVI